MWKFSVLEKGNLTESLWVVIRKRYEHILCSNSDRTSFFFLFLDFIPSIKSSNCVTTFMQTSQHIYNWMENDRIFVMKRWEFNINSKFLHFGEWWERISLFRWIEQLSFQFNGIFSCCLCLLAFSRWSIESLDSSIDGCLEERDGASCSSRETIRWFCSLSEWNI